MKGNTIKILKELAIDSRLKISCKELLDNINNNNPVKIDGPQLVEIFKELEKEELLVVNHWNLTNGFDLIVKF